MAQLSSRRCLAAAAAVSSLTLAVAVAAPSVTSASTHRHRAKSHGASGRLAKSTEYGEILVNGSGRTLCLLTADTATTLARTGGCTGTWYVLSGKGSPVKATLTSSKSGSGGYGGGW